MNGTRLRKPEGPTFYFIGVTTGQSSSRRVFPLWMEALGRPDVTLAGIDLEIHAAPERYRQVVTDIKREPLALGALVTTHKIDLLAAAGDLFDDLGPFASATRKFPASPKMKVSCSGGPPTPSPAVSAWTPSSARDISIAQAAICSCWEQAVRLWL